MCDDYKVPIIRRNQLFADSELGSTEEIVKYARILVRGRPDYLASLAELVANYRNLT